MTRRALPEFWSWTSWITSANQPGSGFPLQNIPFCAFLTPLGERHLGVGIGDFVLDLHALAASGLLDQLTPEARSACTAPALNALMGCGASAASHLRRLLIDLLKQSSDTTPRTTIENVLIPQAGAAFVKPVEIGNYTDFYASIEHATNVGRLFRPDQPLLPNYKFIPIGYGGRASSIVASGTPIRRPHGQTRPPSADLPTFGPTHQLDYEVELAAYIGRGNPLGQPIPIADAESHLFGVSLLNDWSARDIQAWEYQPLGPFLGKSFATSVSPWVVPMAALEPFRVPLATRADADPRPLPYLEQPEPERAGIDLTVEVHFSSEAMRSASLTPVPLSSANAAGLYWSLAQMLTHHTSNGCNLLAGDLIGTGTISGPVEGSYGSLLEITRRGASPIHLSTGETRSFLEDGDEVILRGFCRRPGRPNISLGECRGVIAAS